MPGRFGATTCSGFLLPHAGGSAFALYISSSPFGAHKKCNITGTFAMGIPDIFFKWPWPGDFKTVIFLFTEFYLFVLFETFFL